MKYVYSMEMCSACKKLKRDLKEKGIPFVERDGNRLIKPDHDRDEIDLDAFVQLSQQNMTFPVEVDCEDTNVETGEK